MTKAYLKKFVNNNSCENYRFNSPFSSVVGVIDCSELLELLHELVIRDVLADAIHEEFAALSSEWGHGDNKSLCLSQAKSGTTF